MGQTVSKACLTHKAMLATCLYVACLLSSCAPSEALAGWLGANKFDLALQFDGRASGGDGSASCRRVTRAMAAKAIGDAQDAGFTFFRVSAAGYAPSWPTGGKGDLAEWLNEPTSYWADMDAMFDAVDAAHLRLVPSFIWNVQQFPALTAETTADLIKSPDSRSRALVKRYIAEFIIRYRHRHTILFYEMGNELDLLADLDQVARCRREHGSKAPEVCASVGNYTTQDLIAFSRDITMWIKHLDPTRGISSGFAGPRMDAAHLERHPEFAAGGPDWTGDTRAELTEVMQKVNAPFDIVSLHIYPDPKHSRAAAGLNSEGAFVEFAAALFHPEGKKVFVGEFGATGPSNVFDNVATLLQRQVIDFAALWVWEFYQFSPNEAFDPSGKDFRVEPGHSAPALLALQPVLRTHATTGSTPRVVLTWPLPCARVDHPVELSAVASVGAAQASTVAFFVNGRLQGIATTVPFHVHFDPSSVSSPVTTIEARVKGENGSVIEFASNVLLHGSTHACSLDP